MNSKTTTNSQLSTSEAIKQKQKISQQLEQEQNHRNEDHMEGYQGRGVSGEWQEKVQGIRSIIYRHKIDGEVKNSIGNVEAKELTRPTHGHELRGGGAGQRAIKERKKLGQL